MSSRTSKPGARCEFVHPCALVAGCGNKTKETRCPAHRLSTGDHRERVVHNVDAIGLPVHIAIIVLDCASDERKLGA